MSLTINHPEVDILAHVLMSYTGETLTQAVLNALGERLKQERAKRQVTISLKDELLEIGRACAALPILDTRSPEVILGYNEFGVAG
jgi:antitoxin VapB